MAQPAAFQRYEDFVVRIVQAADGTYRVEASGPTGEADAPFVLPFDEKDLRIFLLEVGQPRRMAVRGRVPEPMQPTVDFGGQLFEAVVTGPVRDIFVSARHDAQQSGYGLRFQLRLANAPELADLPWEFLYDGRDFLALSDLTPVVRTLDLPDAPRAVQVDLPLRILLTVSSPQDLPPLDVIAERARIEQAVARLQSEGLIALDVAENATLSTLERALRQASRAGQPYHVWHFIGHGAFDPANQGSVLAFCNETGLSYDVSGFQLGTLFNSYPELRLALLNACEGARPDREDPFAGVAAALVERGVPAVIGMQFEITDRAAVTFAAEFYRALVDGLPVDAALIEARRAVFFMPNWVEWATPVLFLRARDGQLFSIAPERRPTEQETSLPVPSAEQPVTLAGTAGPAEGRHFELWQVETTIGRARDNDILVAGPNISRHHAKILKRMDGFWLADLHSTNGTFVNGHQIDAPVLLQDGDQIAIGTALLTVSMPTPAQDRPPTPPPGEQPSREPVPAAAPADAPLMVKAANYLVGDNPLLSQGGRVVVTREAVIFKPHLLNLPTGEGLQDLVLPLGSIHSLTKTGTISQQVHIQTADGQTYRFVMWGRDPFIELVKTLMGRV